MTEARHGDARQRSRSLWFDHRFRRLWAAQTLPWLELAVTSLALPLVAITALDASPLEVGILGAMRYLPQLLLSLPLGIAVDRRRRRPVMLSAELVRFATLATVPLAALFGVLTMAQLCLAAFVLGTASLVSTLAGQAVVQTVLPHDALVDGSAKLAQGETAADVAGPALGGFIVSAVAAPFALVVSAVSSALTAVALCTLRIDEPITIEKVGARHELGQGWHAIAADEHLRRFTVWAALYNGGQSVVQAVLLIYLTGQLHLEAGLIGALQSVGCVGGLVGALAVGRVSGRIGIGPAIILFGGIAAGSYLLLPVPAVGGAVAVALVALAFVLDEGGSAVSTVLVSSARLSIIPPQMIGRVGACNRVIAMGVIPLGYVVGGWLGDVIGTRATLVTGALVLGSSIIALASPRLVAQRDLPRANAVITRTEPATVLAASEAPV
jgi:predicted MFS family arabinose efflux permease